jgi:hypothetical protein
MYYFSLLILTLFFGVSDLFSKERSRLNTNQKVDALENSVTSITQTTPLDTITVQTASANPIRSETPTTASIAAVFFKPSVQGSAFAVTNNREGSDLPIEGNLQEASLKWDWGVRALLAQAFNEQNFTLSGEFTYLKTHGDRAASQPLLTSVIPLKGFFTDSTYYAKSTMRFKFLNLDVALFRDYFSSKTLSVKPAVGVKTTWAEVDETTFYAHDYLVHQKYSDVIEQSKVWGIGPLGSVTTKWYFCDHVFFFGKLGTSALYSYKRASQENRLDGNQEDYMIVSQKYHEFVPYMELNLGFTLYKVVNDSQQCIQFSVAYESQYYWGLRRTFGLEEFNAHYRTYPINGNVSLYGVTSALSVIF